MKAGDFKNIKEGELIIKYQLNKILEPSLLMEEWLSAPYPELNTSEQYIFDSILQNAVENITAWNEEDLKMKFISFVLSLGGLIGNNKKFVTFFEKSLSATVEGEKLSVRSDFLVAKGVLDYLQKPYFHFQEYKPNKNPTGDPMAQILLAFLIAQEQNRKDQKEIPLYGAEVIGANWRFVIMENKTYHISESFDCTKKESLMRIIGVLRKFKEILETRLLFI